MKWARANKIVILSLLAIAIGFSLNSFEEAFAIHETAVIPTSGAPGSRVDVRIDVALDCERAHQTIWIGPTNIEVWFDDVLKPVHRGKDVSVHSVSDPGWYQCTLKTKIPNNAMPGEIEIMVRQCKKEPCDTKLEYPPGSGQITDTRFFKFTVTTPQLFDVSPSSGPPGSQVTKHTENKTVKAQIIKVSYDDGNTWTEVPEIKNPKVLEI